MKFWWKQHDDNSTLNNNGENLERVAEDLFEIRENVMIIDIFDGEDALFNLTISFIFFSSQSLISLNVSTIGMTLQQHSKHPDWDKLWERVQNWDWNWLEDYIESHDINQCRDEQGNTLLHQAVHDENQFLFSIILQFSHLIDPNIKNTAGQTALQLAQDTGAGCVTSLPIFYFCIDFAKASSEPNGLDALFAAIYRGDATLGDTSGVQDDGNERNAGGWTALHCAVMYDRPHLIHELRERFPNLDANCLTSHICSALRLAVLRGHSNCIIALSECFPAIKAGDALHAACQYNRSACIPILRKYLPQLTGNELAHSYFRSIHSPALLYAVQYNNPECIRALHSCFPDIDPNLQDRHGNTALIAAAQHPESPDCILVLSECFPDIDPNKQDNFGYTALMHACQQGLPQSITLLATFFPSIDVNMRNKAGKIALMLAIERNYEQCLMTLCESFPNMDPNIQDDHGQTALMVAVRADDSISIISQLFKFFPNIDPNKPDKDQNTALMYLLRSFCCPVEYVRHFLDTFPNVDVNIQNDDDETALTLAIQTNDDSIVALLLECFPDISFINSTGQTALVLAIEKNNTNLLSQVLKHISQIE